MSAFDRLQNYSSRQKNISNKNNNISSVFDTSTPEGCFFDRIHESGYDLYENSYVLKENYQGENLEKTVDDNGF